jgi:hypothetical protein
MNLSAVKGYGDFEVESFDDYYARWPNELSNFPRCVAENWVYRHWSDFEHLWLDRKIELFEFVQVALTNTEIMAIGHVGDWLETLDYWGDELFRNKMRQETWLAKYMLEHGTSPAPIIVAPDAVGLEHPRGLPMHPNQLIEGHMRLAYLRGMIRHHHPALKPSHLVWHVSLPNNSFKPTPLRGAA